jgi:hypothetical protein
MKTALTTLRGHVDEAGSKIQARGNLAFAAANKEWDIYTVTRSSKVAGELSNDENVLPKMQIVIMDYLTDNYWGVKDTRFKNLIFKWRNKPEFGKQQIPKTVDWFIFGYMRADEGYEDFRGIVASQG